MNIEVVGKVIIGAGDVVDVVPALLFIVYYRGLTPPLRTLGCFFVVSLVLKIITLFMSWSKVNNMSVYHLIGLAELVFFFLYYGQAMARGRAWTRWVFVLALLYISYTWLEVGLERFNALGWAGVSLLVLSLGLYYFYHLYRQDTVVAIDRHPGFFINAGLLIYAAGSFFTYLLGWRILSQPAEGFFHNAWIIQVVATLVRDIAVAYGIWLHHHNLTNSRSSSPAR
ncbi:MAG: hypothetical protein WBA12_12610 [Catalinimonas sp.]